jgi:hypothetical protein
MFSISSATNGLGVIVVLALTLRGVFIREY